MILKLNYKQKLSRYTTEGFFNRWIVVRHEVVVDTGKNWAVETGEVSSTGRCSQYQAQHKRHYN